MFLFLFKEVRKMKDLYETIGARIKELRMEYGGGVGMSQEDLADKMGTTANTISRWEGAVYKPSAMDLHKLANIFKVNISTFFPKMETPQRLQGLMSALGDLGERDLDEITQYAMFRKARRELEAARKAKKARK